MANKFLLQDDALSRIIADKYVDMACIRTHETDNGWKYNLTIGPMRRNEYFEKVHHEAHIFGDDENETETFEAYKQSIPEQFIMIDLDCFDEDVQRLNLTSFIREVKKFSQKTTERLSEYIRS